ncbi:MAG TPA: DUF2304 domain-containing protein [Microthrixaceae bacterium]|nr:DUF2304 domain-containing protein [Microthrixaceae bacterium]
MLIDRFLGVVGTLNLGGAVSTSDVPVSGGALSTRAHVFVIVVTLIAIAWVIRLVRREKLRTKYSLLWIFVAVVLATVAVFPGLLERLSNAAGVYYPPATFLIMAVGFLFVIVVHFSWEFSRSDDRIRALAEEIALLRAELEALEQSAGTSGSEDRMSSDKTDPH